MKIALLLTLFCFIITPTAFAWQESSCKKLNKEEIKKKLSNSSYAESTAFDVTQNSGTEYAGTGRIIDPPGGEKNPAPGPGIFVDIVSGEPLFSTLDQYHSGTGWPSFTRPINKENVIIAKDPDGSRNEVRSKCAKSHLGHVFDDGPAPTGLRYCMNSASLRFIPKNKLKAEGYGEFEKLFEKKN
jgi:methionine-R-sulfoxide reductase